MSSAALPAMIRLFGARGTFFFLAACTGAMAGVGAWLLKTAIGAVTRLVSTGMAAEGPDVRLLLLPLGGILLALIFQRYVLKMNVEHGCDKINESLDSKAYRLPTRLTLGPGLAATMTLGMGGSAGSEGPIAYTGAALGSNLGRAFSLDDEHLRLLIGIGAAAGIAGIFKAPVGGMLFAIEVLGLALTTESVIALVVACLMGGAVASACSGYTLDVAYHQSQAFGSEMLMPLLLLGVFCGLYSMWYSFCMTRTLRWIRHIPSVWLRAGATGLGVGALVFLFPNLYGEGYGTVDNLINGDFTHLLDHSVFFGADLNVIVLVVAAILVVKGFAVQATNSGGGVGGDFAPTLFAGALCGFLFATVANHWLGTQLSVADFAFFGMAAVMAGAIQAPLMALFLTSEMTGDMSMLLPLSISAAISYGMVRFCRSRWRDIFPPVWQHIR